MAWLDELSKELFQGNILLENTAKLENMFKNMESKFFFLAEEIRELKNKIDCLNELIPISGNQYHLDKIRAVLELLDKEDNEND